MIARRLKLVLMRVDTTLFSFNHFLIVPLARLKINIRIDNISLRVKVLIVPDEQLSKEVIIGRGIRSKPGVQAISDATGTFTFNRLDKRNNKLEVNVVNVDEKKAIEINDIYCGELDKNKVCLANLLNDY